MHLKKFFAINKLQHSKAIFDLKKKVKLNDEYFAIISLGIGTVVLLKNLDPLYRRMLCIKSGWNWLSGSGKVVDVFLQCHYYLPFEKKQTLLVCWDTISRVTGFLVHNFVGDWFVALQWKNFFFYFIYVCGDVNSWVTHNPWTSIPHEQCFLNRLHI